MGRQVAHFFYSTFDLFLLALTKKMKLSSVFTLIALFLTLACQTPPSAPSVASFNLYAVDSTLNGDALTAAYIAPYKDSLQAVMGEVLGYNRAALIKKKPETPLSNFVSDLLLEAGLQELRQMEAKTYPAVSVVNIKGLRTQLPEGEVNVGNIFELMPFENQMVILEMKGKDIRDLYSHIGASNGDGLGGGRLEYSDGQLVSATVDNRKIVDDGHYYVVTSDYLAAGGDHYTMFARAETKYVSSKKIRDLIIDHIRELTKNNRMIDPSTSHRVILK